MPNRIELWATTHKATVKWICQLSQVTLGTGLIALTLATLIFQVQWLQTLTMFSEDLLNFIQLQGLMNIVMLATGTYLITTAVDSWYKNRRVKS